MDPRAFRFVDNLPPGATVICWDGRLLLVSAGDDDAERELWRSRGRKIPQPPKDPA